MTNKYFADVRSLYIFIDWIDSKRHFLSSLPVQLQISPDALKVMGMFAKQGHSIVLHGGKVAEITGIGEVAFTGADDNGDPSQYVSQIKYRPGSSGITDVKLAALSTASTQPTRVRAALGLNG